MGDGYILLPYTNEGHEVELAKIVAQLVREGVTFKVTMDYHFNAWRIELTGGY